MILAGAGGVAVPSYADRRSPDIDAPQPAMPHAYATPIRVAIDLPRALAVGGHMNNTVAIAIGRDVFVSRRNGDLDTREARYSFETAIADLCRTHRFTPSVVVADMHPDYASTRWAFASGCPVVTAQHHEAHVASCAAENGVTGPYLGVAWDSGGYGRDSGMWGGEFFIVDGDRRTRVAHLRPFPLLGSDPAARQGWRVALSMDWAVRGAAALAGRPDADLIAAAMAGDGRVTMTTSVGRLFDAVASISGIANESRVQGEAAMAMEAVVDSAETREYPFGDGPSGEWEPLLDALRADMRRGAGASTIAARFHRTLIAWMVRVARLAGVGPVVLSGGVFQNAFLADQGAAALTEAGHRVFTHHQVSADDDGLSLGQVVLSRAVPD
jgi:hydrogenase maturation protein HypF